MEVRQTLTEWADMVIKIWIEKMQQLGISNPTAHSFIHHIISSANGDKMRVEFAFNYFLKFTDMGVGKLYWGKYRPDSIYTVRNNDRGLYDEKRKKKQWFNGTFPLEIKKLANIMAQKHAYQGVLLISENVKDAFKKDVNYKLENNTITSYNLDGK